jgi:hypothetical protein
MSLHVFFSAFSFVKEFEPEGRPQCFFDALREGENGLEVSDAVKMDLQKYIANYEKE